MLTGNDLLAILGAFAGMLAGFFAIAKIMLSQASKDRDADRGEREHLSSAITHMATSNEKIAKAVVRQADEAKLRNGHLADLVTQGTENTKLLAEGAVKSITEVFQQIPEQHIEHVHVEHQEIAEIVQKGKS